MPPSEMPFTLHTATPLCQVALKAKPGQDMGVSRLFGK